MAWLNKSNLKYKMVAKPVALKFVYFYTFLFITNQL